MSEPAWFESWFESPLYEALYAHRDETEARRLADWIERQFPPAEYPQVLDMACGRGRHSLGLASRGYGVTGVDLAERAVQVARELAHVAGLQIRFEQGDIRTWKGGSFDLVCNLFTSFGYFEDDETNRLAVAAMAGHLKPGGWLVMDYLNPAQVRAELVPQEEFLLDELQCRITRSIDGDTVQKCMVFRHAGSGRSQTFEERVKLYDAAWFREAFEVCGLDEVGIYGDYDGGAFIGAEPGPSPRQLMTARRPG